MKNISFIGGFMDTRTNNEDFALTPYLFLVRMNGKVIKVLGIGICWGWYAIHFGFALNAPKGMNRWINKLPNK